MEGQGEAARKRVQGRVTPHLRALLRELGGRRCPVDDRPGPGRLHDRWHDDRLGRDLIIASADAPFATAP